MTEPATGLSHQIEERLLHELRMQDPEVQVRVRRASLGWLYLHVISTVFAEQDLLDREERIDAMLAALDVELSGYPILDWRLQTPQEAEAAKEEPFPPIEIPLWSEILTAPEPEKPIPVDQTTTKRPLVVTFYSFKGGVGRSTALAFVGSILATRGRRVVMIDFDLEAPGLSFTSSSEASRTTLGVLDYLHQRTLTPKENIPAIAECVRRIDIPTRGELYLVPAGEYAEGYIPRLTDLDVRFFCQGKGNPIHQLLDDINAYLDPDVILIDARTGFTEIGAIALFDKADLGIICFSPTDQNFAGLQWVVEAASKQRNYRGFPDLRFVLTPMPAVDQSQQQQWITRTAAWITDHWVMSSSVVVEDLYYQIPYNPSITTLTNLFGEMPAGILEPYIPVADAISASLPPEEDVAIPDLADHRIAILSQLKFETRPVQEIGPEDIVRIFQPTGDFSRFLEDHIWFVRGAQGTGKTMLFRLLVERPQDVSRFVFRRRQRYRMRDVDFVPGHGPAGLRKTLLTSADLSNYEPSMGWWGFWEGYMLLQLVAAFPEVQVSPSLDPQLVALATQDKPQSADILSWLDEYYRSNERLQSLSMMHQWLQEHQQKVWLLYDELDIAFGEDYNRRRQVLDALLGWWLEMGPGFGNIVPKIFVREDIWSELDVTSRHDRASAGSIQLRWEAEDLWRLVLRQALDTSQILARLVSEHLGVGLTGLNNIEKEQLQKALYPLWGERMESGNKAYTHTWVSNRISDSQNNRFPRSLLQLLEKAVYSEKGTAQLESSDVILHSKELVEALPLISEQRVMEIRNTYPEFTGLLDKLRGERSPIALDRLSKIWQKDGDELKSLVSRMVVAGILKEHLHLPDTTVPRYTVAELYLYGLGMKRQGQR
jgi:MinD-like ATPase involved in chromosome partitioning or flagellar assembly